MAHRAGYDWIADAVSARLERVEWSVAELSRRAEVRREKLSAYLNGSRRLASDELARVFDALGLEVRPKRRR
jgi:lambda repressor-like predicted transcriptional regulator